jgi:hypothetical protein
MTGELTRVRSWPISASHNALLSVSLWSRTGMSDYIGDKKRLNSVCQRRESAQGDLRRIKVSRKFPPRCAVSRHKKPLFGGFWKLIPIIYQVAFLHLPNPANPNSGGPMRHTSDLAKSTTWGDIDFAELKACVPQDTQDMPLCK